MRFKPKFKPNLAEAGSRSRNRVLSGTGPTLSITAEESSGSAVASSAVAAPPDSRPAAAPCSPTAAKASASLPPPPPPPPPLPQPVASPPPSATPTSLQSPLSPPLLSPVRRQRRLTEQSVGGTAAPLPSLYDKRKAEHKRRFHGGAPERKKMTMFDLIYYNPVDGSRMSGASSSVAPSRGSSRASSVSERVLDEDAVVPDRLRAVRDRLEEEMEDVCSVAGSQKKDDSLSLRADSSECDDDDRLPVPKVKVGPNGEMIIDEESTFIETTAAKKGKEELLKSPPIFENASHSSTNYGSWGKKRKNVDWSSKETVRFYRALSVFGTDFSMMEGIFKKRSRHELKMKFKKEERANRALVDKCLREGMQFDISTFGSESEEDDEAAKPPKPPGSAGRRVKPTSKLERKRCRRTSTRKAKLSRNYLSGSEGEEESSPDEPHAQFESSPLRTNEPVEQGEESQADQCKSAMNPSSPKAAAAAAFPPGFLDANPGLASAVPGSLVVVASSNTKGDAAKDKMVEVVYHRVRS